jgi:hypothetical protein
LGAGSARALHHHRLDRVGRGRPGEHVAPAVAGLPEPGVVAQHPDAHAERGEQEPRRVEPGGDVDPEATERDRGPARELTAHLLDDPRLAGVRHRQVVPAATAGAVEPLEVPLHGPVGNP